MGDKHSKYLQKETCDVKCQEVNKKRKLYAQMKKMELELSSTKKKYDMSKNKYYNHIYGPSWIRNKNLKSENSDLETKYERKIEEYMTEFKLLSKNFIDSLYLLKNQKEVIDKNKIFSKTTDDEIQKQQIDIKQLDIELSTANRNINFSKNEIKNIEISLKRLQYVFYFISTFVGIIILYIVLKEIIKIYK